jgi:hypothetical protein
VSIRLSARSSPQLPRGVYATDSVCMGARLAIGCAGATRGRSLYSHAGGQSSHKMHLALQHCTNNHLMCCLYSRKRGIANAASITSTCWRAKTTAVLRKYTKNALDCQRRSHLIWLSENPMVWRITHAPTRMECADHSWRAALYFIGSRWYTRHAVSRISCSMSREVIKRTRGGLPLKVCSRYNHPRGVAKSAAPRNRAKR